MLLYCNALRQKQELELTPMEFFDTHTSMIESGFQLGVGITVRRDRGCSTGKLAGLAGYIFFLIPVGMTIIGMARGTARQRIEAALAESDWLAP